MSFDYTFQINDSTATRKYARNAREVMRLFYELKAQLDRLDDSFIDGIGEQKMGFDADGGHSHDGSNATLLADAAGVLTGHGALRYAIVEVVCNYNAWTAVDFSASGITQVLFAELFYINTEVTPLYANKSVIDDDFTGTNRNAYLLLDPGSPDVLWAYQNLDPAGVLQISLRVLVLGVD